MSPSIRLLGTHCLRCPNPGPQRPSEHRRPSNLANVISLVCVRLGVVASCRLMGLSCVPHTSPLPSEVSLCDGLDRPRACLTAVR